ncbi:MAG: hypothetical protein NVS4B1_15260 [Ktedonobacteraceae bacterium]
MNTGPRRLGKYELRERLARGGQGEVWKAFDLQLRRFVAIKQLNANLQDDPSFISRFEREAQFIASLHHPNIVHIHDFQFMPDPDSDTPVAYMIMEYIEGSTLADYIRNTSRKQIFPSPSALLTIFTAISLALDSAHQRGMIHRDIKPANIMLDMRNPDDRPLGKPVLMDFGIAKLQGGSDTTKVLGTPLYVSPEQAQGLPGDRQSDLYSLGIILYEMTTGVTPFRGETMMELLMRHFYDTPTPPILINPEIPQAVSDVILKSIAKEPKERFSSASAMTIALAQAFNLPIPSALQKTSTISDRTHGQATHNPLSLPGNSAADLAHSYETYPSQSPVIALPLTPPPINTLANAENSNATRNASAHTENAQLAPPFQPAPPSAPLPVTQRVRKRSVKGLYSGLAFALLLVLSMGVVGYVLWGTQKTHVTPPVATTRVGQVFFLTSQNTTGAFDEAQITLHGLQNAPSDKSYYAWLVIHDDSIEHVHWSLTVQNGTLSSPTYVHPQHHNLLTSFPYLFLITLQSVNATVPSFIANDDLYYAVIPQTKSKSDNFSVVDHLNHLLTSDPNLERLGLQNGLRYWLLANTQALLQEANGANDAQQNKQVLALRQHLINMLYYLRGSTCAPLDARSVPQGTPTTPDAKTAPGVKVSLLDCPQNTLLSSLLTHSELHVRGIIQAPGATPTQITLAPQIQTNLVQVRTWLMQLYQQDILHLLSLSDSQLLQPSEQSFFDDMKTVSNEVYNGQTSTSKTGMVHISNDLQHLATFDIMPCPRSTSNICTS